MTKNRSMTLYVTPENSRIYAVGDIHGRADQLSCLLDKIAKDMQGFAGETQLVFLGDYIDRGHQSADVIRILSELPAKFRVPCHFLRGNHEDMLQAFWDTEPASWSWINLRGGAAFLGSYGIPVKLTTPLESLRDQLKEAMPQTHKSFFADLLTKPVILGNYLFIHAGLKRGVPLESQAGVDMRWMRTFMQAPHSFPYFVVVGHTPAPEPQIAENAMCIDTGCGTGGPLTCLVLEQAERRFITATAAEAANRPMNKP